MTICTTCGKLVPDMKVEYSGETPFGFCGGHSGDLEKAVRRVYDNIPEYGEFVKKMKSRGNDRPLA